jgi:hypothetical protein
MGSWGGCGVLFSIGDVVVLRHDHARRSRGRFSSEEAARRSRRGGVGMGHVVACSDAKNTEDAERTYILHIVGAVNTEYRYMIGSEQ